jgi:hypothetical protein
VVAAGSDCWVGCGGLYKLGCHSSLALVNERVKAGGACADRACADGGCADGAFADGACTDGAFTDGACIGGACADGACIDGAVVVAGVGRLGRGSSFEACGPIAFS